MSKLHEKEYASKQPGTVSNILWHFTGGPRWNSRTNKQNTKLKSYDEAYEILLNIIRSKEIRIGNYKEVVHYRIRKQYSICHNEVKLRKNIPSIIESKPVCCLAEIPIQYIHYHANRYGKIAIGLYPSS